MVEKKVYKYQPDYAVPPGETLRETIEHYGMSQAELADRTGRPKKTINEIIKGKTAITPETALQFERVLGVPDSFWNNLERNYQEAIARKKERQQLQHASQWLDQVPWREMTRRNWIKKHDDRLDQLREVLSFFGVVSPQTWENLWRAPQTSFRQSPAFQANPWAVSVWLRKGEIEAQKIKCASYQREKFKLALLSIRKLTMNPPELFLPDMRKRCAESGVALVFVRELPRSRVSGATRWMTPEKALIELSLRYKSDDQYWFSFFHEAGHILLHGKKKVFIDDGDANKRNEKEVEADKFSADFLIPPEQFRLILDNRALDETLISSTAAKLHIAPGIIIGRLQHEAEIPFNRLNHLKRRLDWERVEEILAGQGENIST